MHLLLSHSRALLVSSALFHPFYRANYALFLQFTVLKCPFDGPFTALKCPFDGPFTALKCPFQMAPCPFENLGRTLTALLTQKKLNISHTWLVFSSVLPFLLSTHSVNCAVPFLLCHSRALLVNSALFLPFTALIMPFFFNSPR